MQAMLQVYGGSHVQRKRQDKEAAKGHAGGGEGVAGLIVRNWGWDWRGAWLKACKRGEGSRVSVDFEKGAEL